jgi:hypothetical protein
MIPSTSNTLLIATLLKIPSAASTALSCSPGPWRLIILRRTIFASRLIGNEPVVSKIDAVASGLDIKAEARRWSDI